MTNCELTPISERKAGERVTFSRNGTTATFEWEEQVWTLIEKKGKYIPDSNSQPQTIFEQPLSRREPISPSINVNHPVLPGITYVNGVPVKVERGNTLAEIRRRSRRTNNI